MRANRLVLLAVITGLMATGCSGDEDTESAELAKYKNCLETETSKLLDETGSNFVLSPSLAHTHTHRHLIYLSFSLSV